MPKESPAISDLEIPRSSDPVFQHLLDTYASETNKVASVWLRFSPEQLSFRGHDRSSTVGEIMKHELLSQRRFFGEFLGTPEPPPNEVLPKAEDARKYVKRLVEMAKPRLAFLSRQNSSWWLEEVSFFDVTRQRIWIFWRRLLHTCHHRTQLTVYLRMLDRPVPSVYGPTADETWSGADPTTSVSAAGRK